MIPAWCREPFSPAYCDRRPIRNERGTWFRSQSVSESFAIELLKVTLERDIFRLPDLPLWMLDLILDRSAMPLRGVAPVMFGDELFLRIRQWQRWGSAVAGTDREPPSVVTPTVFRFAVGIARRIDERRACGACDILFVIDPSSDCGDRPSWHDFADKHHAAPPAFVTLVANIKTQIDLFKVAMHGDRDAQQFRIQELKRNQADECRI